MTVETIIVWLAYWTTIRMLTSDCASHSGERTVNEALDAWQDAAQRVTGLQSVDERN